MLRSILTGAALRDLLVRSPWYAFAFGAALFGAALDGWLSPVVIDNHPGTGELNPVSAFHVLDAVAFASVRVFAVVVATTLVAIAVARQGTSAWSHSSMALIAGVNYVNGTVALSSGFAAIVGAHLDLATFADVSLTAALLALVGSLVLSSAPGTVAGVPTALQDRIARRRSEWARYKNE